METMGGSSLLELILDFPWRPIALDEKGVVAKRERFLSTIREMANLGSINPATYRREVEDE